MVHREILTNLNMKNTEGWRVGKELWSAATREESATPPLTIEL